MMFPRGRISRPYPGRVQDMIGAWLEHEGMMAGTADTGLWRYHGLVTALVMRGQQTGHVRVLPWKYYEV